MKVAKTEKNRRIIRENKDKRFLKPEKRRLSKKDFPPRGLPKRRPRPPAEDVEVPQYSEHQILGALCRASFADFVREFWHIVVPEKLVWNWHLQLLCDEFQRMAERVFKGLPKEHDHITNISPGTSKSTVFSIMGPAWCWTRMPSCRIISGSYQYNLATDLSRKSRDVVKSELYQKCFPGIDIREDQDSKGYFVNTKGGERYAIGIDGGVMGKHAHIIIIDDPLDPKQAASDADLKTANRWMEETLPSRKVDKRVTPIILIMQRLHEYDPAGCRLAKAKKLPVRHICLPAELTDKVNPPELAANYVDGLMDPVRLGRAVLEEAKEQGDFAFAGQYLQDPIPRGGAMFDTTMLKVRTPPEGFLWKVRYWDKAGTSGGGAWTVGALVAKDRLGHYWVLDIVRGQWNSGQREKVMQTTAASDGRKVTIILEQEPGSGGKESAEGSVRNLAGFKVKLHKVGKSDGDKIDRADALSAQVNVGNVSLARGAWNEAFIHEFKFFPKSRYKDQVDATAGGFNIVAQKRRLLGGRRILNRDD